MIFDKIFEYAREADTVLIYNAGEQNRDPTFTYITQTTKGIFEGSALIVKKDKATIVTSQLEEEAARSTGMDVYIFKNGTEFQNILRDLLKDVNTVGLNYNSLSLSSYKMFLRIIPDKEFLDVSASILEARKVKNEEELKKLKEAAKIGSEILPDVLNDLKEGVTEYEVASKIVYYMMRNGASGPSFDTIVAFGQNASMPHYSPGKAKLKKGDFVLMDYGAKYEGYCSDITRTVVFGKASEEQKEMYYTVKKAQEAGMNAIRSGANGKDVDAAARNVIDSTKYKGRFIHSLGHGVGLEVHDHPALSPSLDLPLKESMVVTVEPGVYVPGVGGVRIEDDVVVKKDGFEKITSAPTYELIEVS
ncbi:XAA-pro dipeptidase [X-pro peptidase] [Thermoplasma volcanium GSS1]|uniref:XAA-pro dipeptidase [X-pro peptidase] n=1 Tax=Thermoplasma volcanium (strain ATCC 51530 / DSM 4299 / JCM 9571 / NBRC 15438 / GSS1) TaxID=273116 RepID=Q97BA0_THEVO|nr:Xaa-Pro peptidase family protein [Thermoplasma volcanium]BAB59699.1 XAA-pro dipeptidase [X-pro peptidase] [Thermoplasma volcanium GSS1]